MTEYSRDAGGALGVYASASFTPAAAAYGAGDIMGTTPAVQFPWVFGNGMAVPGGSIITLVASILKIGQTGLQASEAGYTLHNYNVTPPSAQADNAAWALAAGDLAAYLGSIDLGTPVDVNDATLIRTTQTVTFRLIGASSYHELVTVAGFTATAVARQVELIGIIR